MITNLKILANSRDVPYHSLFKFFSLSFWRRNVKCAHRTASVANRARLRESYITMCDFLRLLVAIPFLGFVVSAEGARLSIQAGNSLLVGERPGITVDGVDPGERVRLHSFRSQMVSVREAGAYVNKNVIFHAWADFAGNSKGTVDVDAQPPVAGSYSGADPRGFFWSGYAEGSGPTPPTPGGVPAAETLKGRVVRFELERKGAIADARSLALRLWNDDIEFTKVETPNVVGYFAAPKGALKLPVAITLHGSEGGTFDAAKRDAGLFASHGFATLSLIYFAWPYSGIVQVPQAFDNIPLERIAYARKWLAGRPEADVTRLALRGVSKGSELALLAAAEYQWVRAVAACVPSSLVWGAFGADFSDGKPHSGFSFAGKPLANIGYGDYAPVEAGTMTLAARHRLDRTAASGDAVRSAAISVERSSARFLLAGSGEDDVWPSLEMSKEVAARLQAAGKEPLIELQLFPHAGHYICGTGDAPSRSGSSDGSTPGGGAAEATGQAAREVWEKTLAFLRGSLR